MLSPYPLPPDMKVRDLGQDDIEIQCPECRTTRFNTGYDVSLKVPGHTLVIDYVRRHVCQACSRGRKVRCIGFVRPYPRSGAEGVRPDMVEF